MRVFRLRKYGLRFNSKAHAPHFVISYLITSLQGVVIKEYNPCNTFDYHDTFSCHSQLYADSPRLTRAHVWCTCAHNSKRAKYPARGGESVRCRAGHCCIRDSVDNASWLCC
jgi:hypothetical protein